MRLDQTERVKGKLKKKIEKEKKAKIKKVEVWKKQMKTSKRVECCRNENFALRSENLFSSEEKVKLR